MDTFLRWRTNICVLFIISKIRMLKNWSKQTNCLSAKFPGKTSNDLKRGKIISEEATSSMHLFLRDTKFETFYDSKWIVEISCENTAGWQKANYLQRPQKSLSARAKKFTQMSFLQKLIKRPSSEPTKNLFGILLKNDFN